MTTSAPHLSREAKLVATIRSESLIQQVVAPPRLRGDEFVATLATGGPGSSSYIIGERVDGMAYDRIIMEHGSPDELWQRIWDRGTDRGAEVDYVLVDDTSSTGFAFSGRRAPQAR